MLDINYETPKPRLVRMGQADEVLDEPKELKAEPPPAEEPTIKEAKPRGRPKKMADKNLDHGAGGPETIREDSAGEKGAIGSHGENAPAQTKVPEGGEDINLGKESE